MTGHKLTEIMVFLPTITGVRVFANEGSEIASHIQQKHHSSFPNNVHVITMSKHKLDLRVCDVPPFRSSPKFR